MKKQAFLLVALLCAGPALAQEAPPLKTAVDGTFAPHAMPKLGGGYEGFNIDLADEIAKRLKRKSVIDALQFSGLVPALQAGTYDYLAAPTTVTKERVDNMLFTEGYLNTDFQFLIKKGAPKVEKLEDLKGKIISVNKGSAYDSWARELEAKIGWKVESFGTQTTICPRAYAKSLFAAPCPSSTSRRRKSSSERTGITGISAGAPSIRSTSGSPAPCSANR